MNKPQHNYDEAVFVPIDEAARRSGFGNATVRKKAAECGAAVKVGKLYRIEINKLLDYLRTHEA